MVDGQTMESQNRTREKGRPSSPKQDSRERQTVESHTGRQEKTDRGVPNRPMRERQTVEARRGLRNTMMVMSARPGSSLAKWMFRRRR